MTWRQRQRPRVAAADPLARDQLLVALAVLDRIRAPMPASQSGVVAPGEAPRS